MSHIVYGREASKGSTPTLADAVVVAWYAMETAQRAQRYVAPGGHAVQC